MVHLMTLLVAENDRMING